MIDELTIYNLSVKYPNTIDLVREVEKMARADAIEEFKQLFWKSKVELRPSQIDEILKMFEQLKEQKNEKVFT